jgi:hypothetical protein
MLGLSRELIEHWLPIKAGFRPYKQGAQNFKLEIIRRVKEEVDKCCKPALYSHVTM